MGRTIKLVDFLAAGPALSDNRDANLRLLDAASAVEGLKVRIRATNSGSLVNNRVYKGIHMKDATDTWVKPYQRPILTHHADGGMWGPPAVDPKGRVESAEFTQLRKGKGFENDYKRPAPGGMGSGYITVEALITDEDAIQKVLDGRYLTVSSSQTTEEMSCSVCGQDWFQDYCEHRPGETYVIETGAGKKKTAREYFCYGIAGALVYRELSFVNVPAQPNATVLGILEKDEKSDNLNMVTWSDHNAIQGMALCDAEGHIISDLTDPKELAMAKDSKKVVIEMPGVTDADFAEDGNEEVTNADNLANDLDTTVTPDEKPVEDKDADADVPANDDDAAESSNDNDDSDVTAMSDEEFALATVVKSIKDNGLWLGSDELVPVFDGATEDSETETPHSHLVICQKTEDGNIVGRTYATIGDAEEHNHVIHEPFGEDDIAVKTRDADAGENHTHVLEPKELSTELDEEATEKLVADLEAAIADEADARLTEAQREALKTKDYCGPNHSFPVTDAEHVHAARKMLVRYKGDAATKERISRSIERKANKLGVDRQTEKPVEPTEPEAPEGDAQAAHRDEALETALSDLAVEKAQVKSLEASLTEKSREVEALEDDLVREKAARSNALANTLTIVRTILEKPDCENMDEKKFEDKVKSYATRTPDSLWDAVSDLLPEVNLVIQNVRKSKVRIIPTADGSGKKPLSHIDSTGKGPKRTPRRKVSGADQLAEDLDS